MRRSSPVQQWLDSMPPDEDSETLKEEEEGKKADSSQEITEIDISTESHNTVVQATPVNDVKNDSNTNITPKRNKKLQKEPSIQSDTLPSKPRNPLLRDSSLQSDGSGSSGCSVLNVLGARKVDAESVLLALGFGPSEKQQKLQRIPDRFLIPSKLQGISTEQFIKDEQHTMKMHDCGVFGYRGLTGNPHAQPSTIVAKIIDCIVKDDELREKALTKARLSVTDVRNGAGYDPGLKNA